MGDISIGRGDSGIAVHGTVTYDPEKAELTYKYNDSKKTAEFEFELDWDSDDNNDNDDETDENEGSLCELYFTDDIPLDLSLHIGLGDGELDLNKLQISSLSVENGLGDAEIDFGDGGNRTLCSKIDINTGLGTAEVKNLGNSNAQEMEFECGLGSMELDFSGKINHDVSIEISVGLGSIDIEIPKGTNVIFDHDANFMSSVDLEDFVELKNGKYRSEDFREGKPTLYFSASVGMGSIDLTWIDR
nr:hypothetical protein [FCB group bacterium]